MSTYQIECQRTNVTLAEFLGYVQRQCRKIGAEHGVDRSEFENPNAPGNIRYFVKDGMKHYTVNGTTVVYDATDCPCVAEVAKTMPLDFQVYVKNHDGSYFNEICEFTFDTENKGSGYYFQGNGETTTN